MLDLGQGRAGADFFTMSNQHKEFPTKEKIVT